LYDVAKCFGRFYHECPILEPSQGLDDSELAKARLCLAACTMTVLEAGMRLILVPFLESM
jgi:arginyl-tRNA synthetase